jgi:signal transduction histidine kinase
MAASSAVGLVLSSAALSLVPRRRALPHQIAAIGVLIVAFSAVLDYLYGVEVAKPAGTTQVAAYTVLGLSLVGIGLLTARPRHGLLGALLCDEPGGLMARWLLLSGPVTLVIFGGLRLAGQQAGLYSARIGVSIMVTGSLVALGFVVAVTANRITGLGRQRTLALRRLAESERRLRRTLNHLLHVQENERRGVAMDLHDDALPALAAVTLLVELASGQCQSDGAAERLERAQLELRALSARLRSVTFDLLPEALAREGLGSALRHRLEQLRAQSGLEYDLRDRVARAPSRQAAAILYRIALEALRNVTRHAQASLVRVELEQRDGRVEVTISDDGVGMSEEATEPGHMGLSMMAERADLAGGGFRIHSNPAGGTTVAFWVPTEVEPDLPAGI